jgi:hypothetical protein
MASVSLNPLQFGPAERWLCLTMWECWQIWTGKTDCPCHAGPRLASTDGWDSQGELSAQATVCSLPIGRSVQSRPGRWSSRDA